MDPSNTQALLAGDSAGYIYRSSNGGSKWTTVQTGKSEITTIEYSPLAASLVLAGTRSGALVSHDGGVTWSAAGGLDGRYVRVFGFAVGSVAAGTDRGIYLSPDGGAWSAAGPPNLSVNALAVEAIHAPVRLVAGGDSSGSSLPLYQSVDGGAAWTRSTPAVTGTIVVRLVAGPLPPTGNVRPLLMGTNSGLFLSTDNGASFTPLSGGGLLPTTDYTQAFFIASHHDRFYAASDGGGSGSGGLWRTTDGGQTFTSLQPPEPSVTALAVTNEEKPTLYIATFKPSTHVAALWAYRDTGGQPHGPGSTVSPVASAARTADSGGRSLVDEIITSPQLPYVALGLGALAVVLTAVAAHLRGRHR